MTKVPRYRYRGFGPFNEAGGYTRYIIRKSTGEVTSTTVYPGGSRGRGDEESDDIVTTGLPRTPNDLLIYKRYGVVPSVSGIIRNPNYSFGRYADYHYTDHIMTTWKVPTIAPSISGLPSNLDGWSSAILANLSTNSRAVDIPLFLFELKDFPRMLRDLGRVLRKEIKPSDVPGGFLAYRFGWAPLFSDLYSLLDLGREVENRISYLLSLKKGKRISRTLHSSETISKGGSVWHDFQFLSHTEETYTDKVWFTCRIGELDESYVDDLLTLYRKARSGHSGSAQDVLTRLTGLRADGMTASTVWNAIPWSWLVDYLASIGTFIEALGSHVPFRPTDVCVMRHQRKEKQYIVEEIAKSPYLNISATVQSGDLIADAKERLAITSLTPKIRFTPLLSASQIAILGSLVTARLLRRERT